MSSFDIFTKSTFVILTKAILLMDKLIQNFSIKSITDFFATKISSFSPNSENLDHILKDADFAHFSDLQKIGEVEFNNSDELIVFTCKFQGVLSERSSKKRQFEIAKKVLKEDFKDGAIFIFYDDNDCFRFSFIRKNYGNKDQKFSNWKRYTYFVDPSLTNKTFKNRINGCNFSSLEDIQEAFSVEKLTKQFYNELFNWYQWAVSSDDGFEVTYPNDISTDKDDRQIEEHLIRLITRIMFVWFIKKKKLIPNEIFEIDFLEKALIDFDPNSKSNGDYYNAVIQNLFFASLNKPIDERTFATGKNHQGKDEHYGIKTLFRDNNNKSWFQKEQNEIIDLFKGVPFLNGGLFECLDKENEDGKIFYYDGFSRVEGRQKRAFLPNCIFFDEQKGIIPLLERYNFTLEENSTDDIEVALDPELLGKVFENLLGAYNPETKETARKQSGSFYTPREIVDYMVNESILQYLKKECPSVDEAFINQLLNTEEVPAGLTNSDCKAVANSLRTIKILDPACGSGAFPMGVLNTLFKTLKKVEPQTNKLSNYDIKLELIENCIYGVDIQSIAVQISKLRFFISLVCEQETTSDLSSNYGIKSLPNLETKFVAANTLIGLKQEAKTMIEWQDETLSELKTQLWDIRCHQNFRAQKWQEKKLLRQQDKDLCKKIEDYLKTIAAKPNLAIVEEYKQQIAKQEIEIANLPEIWMDATDAAQQTTMFESVSNKTQSLFKIDTNKEKRELLKKSNKQLLKKIELETNKQHFADTSEANALIKWNPYDQNTSSPFFDPDWMFGVEKFDVIIGNPPYIKEYTDKNVFNGLRNSPYYQGKMDIWYLFACQNLDFLKKDTGIICFIAPNNWTTNSGASKMRNRIIKDAKIEKLIDFGSYMIFESAAIQTMIMLFKNKTDNENYNFDLRKIIADKATFEDVLDVLHDKKSNNNEILKPTINKEEFIDKTLTFNDDENEIILQKIKVKSNFFLDEKNEVAQGIVPNPDVVSKKSFSLITDKSNIKVGDAVFVVDKDVTNFENFEKKYLKPLFEPNMLNKFFVPNKTNKKLIYLTKKNHQNDAENIINHLSRFKEIMFERRENKSGQLDFFHLHWPRNSFFFEKGSKILCVRKCVEEPVFSYTEEEAFVMMSINIIKTERINQKYLISLLNSKLIAFWLKNKGKMQGNNYQLDKEPLLEIPIYKTNELSQQPFITLVDKILSSKKENIDTTDLETKIDIMVYKLYELTYEEVLVVEPKFSLSKQEYEAFTV